MTDPYSLLGLRRGASDEEVQRRYRELAKQHHPDMNGGSRQSEERFKAISDAYERIKKGSVDPPRPAPPPHGTTKPPGPDEWAPWRRGRPYGRSNVDDMFEAMRAHRTGRNRDVDTAFTVTLEDLFHGKEVELALNLPSGRRVVRFRIPPGLESESVVHVPGAGEHVFEQLPPGDLRVRLQAAPHRVFQRDRTDLHAEIAVNVFDALLGVEVPFKGIDGTSLSVTIPSLCPSGTKLRVRGHGMPSPGNEVRHVPPEHRQHRGDLLLTVRLVMPDNLSDEQREAIRKIRLTN